MTESPIGPATYSPGCPPLRDLRRHPVAELHFPAGSVLVVAGVPGAGKTTLLRRVFKTSGAESTPVVAVDGVRVLDSEQSRNWWRQFLGWMPYPWWRPLIHLTHYVRVLVALREEGPVVVHECGTRGWTRRLIASAARNVDRQMHLLLLDVHPDLAAAGQLARRRQVRPSSFAAHCHSWRRLLEAVDDRTHPIHREAASVTLVDRASAEHLQVISFH